MFGLSGPMNEHSSPLCHLFNKSFSMKLCPRYIKDGVPQGSILTWSSFVSTFFINNIVKIIGSYIPSFADDTSVFI